MYQTGIKNVTPVVNDIFSLDVITVNGHIKRGSYVSSHLHLNVTYLLEADENEELIVNEEETEGVRWLPIDKLSDFCTEEYIIENIYDKLNEKINADENEELIVNEEETEGVRWLPIDKLSDFCTEEYIIENIYDKLNEKINALN